MIGASPRDPVYLEGYNDTNATLAAYHIVSGTRESIALSATTATVAFGVVAQDIADSTYGNCQVGGICVVMAGTAGMTEGAEIMAEAGATGLGVDATDSAGDNVFVIGRCEKAATSGKLGEVRWMPYMKQIDD